LDIRYDVEAIPAISEKRDAMWERVLRADFLSDEEKRKLLGFSHVMDNSPPKSHLGF
jgi:phage portal protein BeeE